MQPECTYGAPRIIIFDPVSAKKLHLRILGFCRGFASHFRPRISCGGVRRLTGELHLCCVDRMAQMESGAGIQRRVPLGRVGLSLI